MKLSLESNQIILSITHYRGDKDQINAIATKPLKIGLFLDDTCCWLLVDGGMHINKKFVGLNTHQFPSIDLDKLKEELVIRAVTPIDEEVLTKRSIKLTPHFYAILQSALQSQKDSGFDEQRYLARSKAIEKNYDSRTNLFSSAHILEEHT